MVHDRPRDRHPLVGVGRPPFHLTALGTEVTGVVRVGEQDGAAVGADGLEDELEDLRQERVHVGDAG